MRTFPAPQHIHETLVADRLRHIELQHHEHARLQDDALGTFLRALRSQVADLRMLTDFFADRLLPGHPYLLDATAMIMDIENSTSKPLTVLTVTNAAAHDINAFRLDRLLGPRPPDSAVWSLPADPRSGHSCVFSCTHHACSCCTTSLCYHSQHSTCRRGHPQAASRYPPAHLPQLGQGQWLRQWHTRHCRLLSLASHDPATTVLTSLTFIVPFSSRSMTCLGRVLLCSWLRLGCDTCCIRFRGTASWHSLCHALSIRV